MKKEEISKHKYLYSYDDEKDMIDERLKDVFYLVEANSNELQNIWRDNEYNLSEYIYSTYNKDITYSNIKPHIFEQDTKGYMITIGEVLEKSIVVVFSFYKIDNLLIGFYYASSNMVDYKMIETWLKKYCNPIFEDRLCYTDASNFHNCLRAIETYNENNKLFIHRKEIVNKLLNTK